ncbi:LAFE_0H10264g1_1 [Lachancea fermentati]|uniref:LAFE_0H10264g1_1 n=1 Tax=Lachancea fermentati TaxID=4955 RepID=A0A1G4MK82_LACFM|nr:LAFE_0H10264g1_1 [Lachancea fermentati]
MISEGAATALATVGTVCWCIQLIPQIIFNYRRKDCEGLPPLMMLLWVVSGIPFAIYFMVTKGNMTLQVQPHLFMFFCSISYIQSLYYPPVQLAHKKIIMIILTLIVVDVGMEVGFTLWLRPLYARGVHWPSLIFGILASVLLGLGLVPPYFELAKRRGRVVGINFIFLGIDSLGAWLSIVSVILGNMDIMGIILYSIVAALELGIFISHFIWCCRFKWFGNGTTEDVDEEKQQNCSNSEASIGVEMEQHYSNSVTSVDRAFVEVSDEEGKK